MEECRGIEESSLTISDYHGEKQRKNQIMLEVEKLCRRRGQIIGEFIGERIRRKYYMWNEEWIGMNDNMIWLKRYAKIPMDDTCCIGRPFVVVFTASSAKRKPVQYSRKTPYFCKSFRLYDDNRNNPYLLGIRLGDIKYHREVAIASANCHQQIYKSISISNIVKISLLQHGRKKIH